jgi:3-isopropylmalate dehydrogenase
VTTSKTYRIVVLPGDGIGPEIVDAALEVLEAVQKTAGGFSLAYEHHRAGAGCYRDTGEPITPQALEAFRAADSHSCGSSLTRTRNHFIVWPLQ